MPMTTLRDDLGRQLAFAQPPRRIVSLVPSDTYSVIALGAADRLVGRTTYCISPEAAGATTVGGTKDVDVEAVVGLAPDLVIANQEENTRPALEAIAARGVKVLVSLPRRVADASAHLARLARILGVGDREPARSLIRRAYAIVPPQGPAAGPRAFVPIWRDPWMTLNDDTYGADVLAHAGFANAFGDRLRLYPLAADLGKGPAVEATGRDIRYPRVTLDEVRARAPELIVLPSEPYEFSAADEAELRAAVPEVKRVARVDGRDLFWYGAWTVDAIARLAAELAS
jgi:ABC-type Fe3+-hydroxamate transport system substrate-binding protein